MSKLFLTLFILSAVFLQTILGCSKVNFEKPLTKDCLGFGADKCVVVEQTYKFSYDVSIPERQVDILFVDDNSASMAVEQQKMGTRFPTFLQSLAGLKYRIAITTTDISAPYSNQGLPRSSNLTNPCNDPANSLLT